MVTGGMRDSLKQDLAREFCRKKSKKDIIILTETHINHDKIYHIRRNWLGFIFFSPAVVTQNVLFHLGIEGIIKVNTDSKGRFVSFKGTPSNNRVLCEPGNILLGSFSL